jgi:uncharacterized protein DUF973
VEIFASPASSLYSATTVGSTTSFSVNANALYFTLAFVVASGAFTLIELWLYRLAFHELAPRDARFSTPAKLVLMAIIALVLLAVVGLALFAEVYEAILCAGQGNPITTSCVNFGAIIGLFALLVLVGIVAFVGWIGLLIGIWRLGTRYDSGLFKVGAILLIFPVLNLVGVLLILIEAHGKLAAFRSVGAPGGFT